MSARGRVRKQLRAFGRVFGVLHPVAFEVMTVAVRLLIYTAVFRLLFTVTCEPVL